MEDGVSARGDELGEQLDALNELLEEASRYIFDCKFCVPAQVPLVEPGTYLSFHKHNNRWDLFIRTENDVQPVYEALFVLRMQAAARIPALVDALRAKSAATTREIEQEASKLRQWLDNEYKKRDNGGKREATN